jgi:enoyl-CoA hydratase
MNLEKFSEAASGLSTLRLRLDHSGVASERGIASESGIARLSLNRPAQRNALNRAMCEDLLTACALLRQCAASNLVRVVLLDAEGPVFCAGADLKERQGMHSQAEVTARRQLAFDAYAALEALPQPVIALLQGPAVGSGCEIAGACDFILASAGASFRYPEVGWGTIGATQRLPRMVGKRLAKELLYTGRLVEASEALRIGLINQLLEQDALPAAALALAQRIAAAPPLAMQLTKRCLDQGMDRDRAGALAIEQQAIAENLAGSDWQGAIADFGNKAGNTP